MRTIIVDRFPLIARLLPLVSLLSAFSVNFAVTQVQQAWVARYNGAGNNHDIPYGIAVDTAGNVYVTGKSIEGPNIESFTTIKYSSAGVEQLVGKTGTHSGGGQAIAVTPRGEVYVSGNINFGAPPGGGGGTNGDFCIIKYDASGVQQWFVTYNGPQNSSDYAKSMAIDSAGNAYVTGASPGLTTAYDIATVKYSSVGIEQWVQRYTGPGRDNDEPNAIAVDRAGSVYVTGFDDRGPTTEWVTIKYSSVGAEEWVRRFGESSTLPAMGKDLVLDSLGNIYVTGSALNSGQGNDYTTIKYSPSGVEEWVRTYNCPVGNGDDIPYAIAIDKTGMIYVTGGSYGGAGTDGDCTTIKYSPDGVELWVRRFNSTENSYDWGFDVAVDTSGNIVVGGGYTDTERDGHFLVVSYDSSGNAKWAERYDGPGDDNDELRGVAVDLAGNAYITGSSHGGAATTIDYATIKYSPQRISLIRPRAGERWISGRQDTIRWAGGLAGEFLDVDYSLDSGQTYRSIDTAVAADSGYSIWTHPDSLLSTRARIRLSDSQSSTVVAESDTFRMKGYVMTRLDATGQYEPFTFTKDRWSFGNIRNNMWPLAWWSQFDYQDGNDPYAFYPYPDWEPFESAPGPFYPDWPLFVQVFGAEDCYWGNPVSRSYKEAATAKWDAMHRRWAGSCSGLSLSSILGFDRKEAFRARYQAIPDSGNLISVALNDSIRLVINELANHWHAEQHQQVVITQKVKTPTQTINDLKTLFLSDGGDHAYLYFANNGQGGGAHAVVPYKVTDSANTSVHFIHLYDNSWPGSANARVRVDTALNGGNGAWTYGLWPGWGGPGKLYVMDPASTYLSRPILSKALPADVAPGKRSTTTMMEFVPTLDASILIFDSQGNSLGYADSTVIEQVPGAVAIIPPTGSLTPPYSYLLPEGAYTIRLTAFSDSVSKFSLFTDSTIISLSRSDASSEQADYIAFDGGLSVRSGDPQAKNMKLKMIFTEESTEEKVFSVNDWSLSQSDSMRFSRAADDNLTVRNFGGRKSYALDVKRASESFQQRFIHPLIQLGPNSSHRIAPAWGDLNRPAVIYVDLGNDESIDDTLVVDNTVSADERNSPTLPAEYALAQNYPNPFNPSTTIRYGLPARSHVTLTVYNMLGQQVAQLVNGDMEAGYHEVKFDGSKLASGVYLYRMQAGTFVETRKLLLVR